MTHDLTDVPILLVRRQDGTLGTFANVCRHRGACRRRERQCQRFQASPSRVDVWDGRTEKAQKYWDKDFERPWQQSSRRILNDCEPREPLRLVS